MDQEWKRLSGKSGAPRLAQQQYQFVAYTKPRKRKVKPASKVVVPQNVRRVVIERTVPLARYVDPAIVEALNRMKEEL